MIDLAFPASSSVPPSVCAPTSSRTSTESTFKTFVFGFALGDGLTVIDPCSSTASVDKVHPETAATSVAETIVRAVLIAIFLIVLLSRKYLNGRQFEHRSRCIAARAARAVTLLGACPHLSMT